MGRAVCAAVEAAPDLELGAAVDVGDDVGAVADAADVAVVFSDPGRGRGPRARCVRLGVHAVVGTTGWTPSGSTGCAAHWLDGRRPGSVSLVAPNFALGAVLLMRFAALAAPHYESVEIVELHHPDKVDAPSGTARHTARARRRRPRARPGRRPCPTPPRRAGRRAGRGRRRGPGAQRCGCAGSSPTRRCCSAARGAADAAARLLRPGLVHARRAARRAPDRATAPGSPWGSSTCWSSEPCRGSPGRRVPAPRR